MTYVVENIGLEALMDRANIIFTNGYVFDGAANINQLKHSFEAVFGCVNKFKFQLNYKSQNDFIWLNNEPSTILFGHQLCDDIAIIYKGKLFYNSSLDQFKSEMTKSTFEEEFIYRVGEE